MTVLSWDDIGQRTYQSGVDHGVLYLSDGTGVPWNGLVSVEERFAASVGTPVYFDGRRINDVAQSADFVGNLKAITYPDEFLPYDGIEIVDDGIYAAGQKPQFFGLSYRVKVGTDLNADAGYRIHVLCNVLATPVQRAHRTISSTVDPVEFEWTITAVPANVPGLQPTAHLIFDSTKMNATVLAAVEDVLYGTDTTEAMLPSFEELINLTSLVAPPDPDPDPDPDPTPHGRDVNASNTGPRITISGPTYEDRRTIDAPGTYSNFTCLAGLTVNYSGPGVIIIEDVRIADDNNSDWANLIITPGTMNVEIRYAEIDNMDMVYYGIAGRGGAVGTPILIHHCDIHGGGFALNAEDTEGWEFYDNFVHDLVAPDPAPYPGDPVWHVDGVIAWGSHATILRNKILIDLDQTAIINFGTWSGSTAGIDDVMIQDNYFAGAGYIFYIEEKDSPMDVTNMVITGNDIGQDFYPDGGYWGVWYMGYPPTVPPMTSGNRIVTTGGAFVANCNYP